MVLFGAESQPISLFWKKKKVQTKQQTSSNKNAVPSCAFLHASLTAVLQGEFNISNFLPPLWALVFFSLFHLHILIMILLEQIKGWLKEISKKLQLQHHGWEPPLTWAVGYTVPEHPGTRLLAPSTGEDHRSFKRARWIIAWCTESIFSLKTHLKYHAKHAKCYRAAPAYNECRQVRILPRIPLGSASSQKEEYQPLSRRSHCLRYLVLATVCGIRNCHRRLSAHTHTLSLWLERAEEHHPFYPGKQSSYSKMTFTVQLLSRRAQNTHITPQLKTLSLLLCNCWFVGFFLLFES